MKNVSPLETQAFNYFTFGFITLLNNLWTRLALSFWSIQTPKPELLPPSREPKPDPIPHESDPDVVSVSAAACVPSPTVVGNGAVDVHGVTKRKFTLYYEDDVDRECETTVTEELEDREEGIAEWWESWQRLLRMKLGGNEKGWYTCQDLTALNGSVVRLWDGGLVSARN